MSWIPLESDPKVMTKYLHKLGVPTQWGLVDMYGLDPDLLAMLPKPVLAIILLYPVNPKLENYKVELESKEKESGASSDKLYHMIQYVSNACGTVALIHSIANNLNQIQLEDGELKKFLEDTKDLSSSERGEKLTKVEGITNAHEIFAQEGQTEAPAEDEKVLYHFIAFVERDGSIYDLDGRKPFPINHGPSSPVTFLDDAARVCREYMKRDPDEVHFHLMALTANE
ncbi:ubiquitin carboxyl-terminal hydrolase isozyme L3 [Copidosoma floridanum]|uniref:ubiquitin carboxyl-terminal hydrolase isozyme L3 n=1 Tax=Copidosoma floridanum TaxID=29053 RepID=UPI0006C99FAA|nr:ubiquitin carboxyl-terminal hydrolase isozyme L3 [Copidosoma floridanum]